MSQTKVKSGLLNFPDQTDFVKLPSGTTAQRPSSPEKGYSRYNTTDNKLEFWDGTIWQQLPGVVAPTIESVSYPGDDLAADPAGGQTITLTGTNFLDGATIEIEGTLAPVVTVVSKTEITFTAPAKTAGDYDILLTNGDNTTATFIDGITYNGLPSWTTPAGNLGTFPAGSTIPTITLVATEPDSGVVSYSVTTGALPNGLTLTGADIDGTVPSPAGQTTYNFSVTASDDENQESTERAFNIVVYLQVTNTVSEVDPFGDSSGVALYRLENNANDEGGVYNGTPSNVTYDTGVFGQAGVFNGSSSYFGMATNSWNSFTSYTASFWIYDTGTATGNRTIVSNYGYTAASNVEKGWIIMRLGNKLRAFNSTTGLASTYLSTNDIPFNQWVHIVVTNTQSEIKIYFNGVLDSTHSTIGFLNDASWPMRPAIGAYRYETTEQTNGFFTGSIDQVRILNRAITPLEVESLYRERTIVCGGQADTLDILGDNSCIATYQLNGNANDLSGNYSGTPINVSYGVGEFDLAGVFNGSSSEINYPLLNGFLNTRTTISVSLWFKCGTQAELGTLFSDYAGNSFNVYLAIDINGKIAGATRYSGNTLEMPASSNSYDDGSWHNIVVVLDQNSNTRKHYVDGIEINSETIPSGSWNGDANQKVTSGVLFYTIGSFNQNKFNGSIDQVRIFNKALNSTEVTTLYNETACDALACSGTTNTLDILSDGSCIAAYPLDGSPADLSGNYDGVQTNVTYPVGKFDLASAFNGSSNGIKVDGFSINTSSFSISLWVKAVSGGNAVLRCKTNYNIPLSIQPDAIYVPIANGTVYALQDIAYDDNSWNHLVVTNSNVFLNGTNVHIFGGSSAQTFGSDITGLVLGNATWNLSNSFTGEIDQVRVFNKALSAGEVTTLYNETACN